jgi:hypothetical protein
VSDVVTDDELLYRCVHFGDNNYHIDETGKARISSQAFRDRSKAPSVDRAGLCNNDPRFTQKKAENAVVSLITGAVRDIKVTQNDAKGNPLCSYRIDVCARPEDGNTAHAQIEPEPTYKNGTPFRKVLERLAFLAEQRGWEILPYELRNQEPLP